MAGVTLDDYKNVIGGSAIDEIKDLGDRLRGYRIAHINSTRVGGGVAEILSSLVPLMKEVGLEADWHVLRGNPEFFKTTKQFHNGLHGQPVDITGEMLEAYLATAKENRDILEEPADLVVIHDQQPLGLTAYRRQGDGRWLWYCHIEPRHAVPSVWYLLAPMASACDYAVFHLPEYARELPVFQYFMPPAIDPLSDKNREVTPEEHRMVLEKLDVEPEGPPIILQVSRFDRLKDPVGVVQAFKMVRKNTPCRLILAGGGASDDPEGMVVLDEVRAIADGDPDIIIMSLPPDANLEINVLQRQADVVVQKSLREGFGLTAAEALWKAKPLVVTPTGGLTHQVLHEKTGLIARDSDEMAAMVASLLANPSLGRRLGASGRELVRQRYILPVYLRNWLRMIALIACGART